MWARQASISVFRAVAVAPRPSRPVPVYIAATSRQVVQAAGARGLPMLVGPNASAAQTRNLLALHAETAADRARPNRADHAVPHRIDIDDSDQRAVEAVRESLPRWLALRTTNGSGRPHELGSYTHQLINSQPIGAAAEHCIAVLQDRPGRRPGYAGYNSSSRRPVSTHSL